MIRAALGGRESAVLFRRADEAGGPMAIVDLETCIADFLALGRRLQADQALTGERVLEELVRWYRESRVTGAALDEEGDMLLLQWGARQQLDITEPTDLRELGDETLNFGEHDVPYLDFTRQVCATNDDEEFDDVAVQMSVTLCHELANGAEPGSNLWINTPADIDSKENEFRSVPFVKSLLTVPAQRAIIKVENPG
jgi:hypothetical protein